MPKISEAEFKELLELFVRGHRTSLREIEPGEARAARARLNQRLMTIYSAEPLPFPQTYDDFRRFVVERFLDVLKKEDPRFRRPRF
jgi:hypothetical protein